MFNILIAQSDEKTRELISKAYKENGYNCLSVDSGSKIDEIVENVFVDLIVADEDLADEDGCDLLTALRKADIDIPIIVIAPEYQFTCMEKAFQSGADDYMVKPVNADELLLRTNALLRRAKVQSSKTVTVGSTTLNYDALSVQVGDSEQTLPQKEFYLMFKLLSQLDRTFTRQELMDEIWGMISQSDEKTVNTHINRLRKRFADNDDFSIVTVRGRGYKAIRT